MKRQSWALNLGIMQLNKNTLVNGHVMNTKMESLAKCPTLLLFDVCQSFPLPMRRYQARIHPERVHVPSSKENKFRVTSPRADNLKSDQSLSRPVQVGLFWSNAAKSELLNGHWWGWKLWHLTNWGGLKNVELWNLLFKDQVLNHHP